MQLCMYVCVRVCMCMYVLYYAYAGVVYLTFVEAPACSHLCRKARQLCMYVCLRVCMYVCVYVSMYDVEDIWLLTFAQESGAAAYVHALAQNKLHVHTYIHTYMRNRTPFQLQVRFIPFPLPCIYIGCL
jgi:hypothetical protein